VAGYVVAHYCLRFDRVVHIAVVGYIVDPNHFSAKPQTVMVNNIASHNNMNHSSLKPQTVMVNNKALRFDRGVLHIAVAVILFPITV
jgi:hypothetical protein